MGIESNFSSIRQITEQYLNAQPTKKAEYAQETGMSFEEVLRKKQAESSQELRFSKHADSRLSQRNINLTENQRKRLEDGTEKARTKGITESLVMVDELAFIVNVKSNTVITAMSQKESEEAVFTNIDGAVII